MKTYLILILLICLTFKVQNSFCQLPNQNTYLLKNLDQYSSYSGLWGYTASDGREYAILGTQVGTSFIDITDSANIREVDSVKGLNSGWREMKTYSHYAYIVSEATNSSLQIVDLQYLPDSVRLVKTWSYAGYTKTHSIQQSGHYLYLNGGNATANGGVTVLDVIDPENPLKLGQWSTLYVHDCRILNDTIWASNIYTGQTSIIDATNKSSLGIVKTWRSYPTSEVSTHNCAFSSDRKFLYTTNEISSPNGRLDVWNIEDLNNITFIREWMPTGITTAVVHNIETYGNYAVIAHYRAGIRILDIIDPSNPMEVAWYDTYPSSNSSSYSGCWGVYKFESGKIIASDMSSGLFVIKASINFIPQPEIKLNLKVLPEGFYYPLFNQLARKDTFIVYLRNTFSPFSPVDSSKQIIDSLSLSGIFTFTNAPTGSYYLSIKHLNSIETWSKEGGEYLATDTTIYSYDFTVANTQAYGNNLKLKGSKYCLYSGDVNQDGYISLFDVIPIYNDASSFVSGRFIKTDLTGDNIIDLTDVAIGYNNSSSFINVIRP